MGSRPKGAGRSAGHEVEALRHALDLERARAAGLRAEQLRREELGDAQTARLRARLAVANRRLETADQDRDDLAVARRRMAQLEAEVIAARRDAERSRLAAEVGEACTQQNRALEQRVRELEAELQAARNPREDKDVRASSAVLHARIRQLQKEVVQAREEAALQEAGMRRLLQLQDQVRDLRAALDDARAEVAAAQTARHRATRLAQRVAELEEALRGMARTQGR